MSNKTMKLALLLSAAFFGSCKSSSLSVLQSTSSSFSLLQSPRFDFAGSNISSHRQLKPMYDYYSEVPDACPAKTSCPVLCVYDEPYCPTKCPKGYNLCLDGSCSIETCDPMLWSPCECDALYFACPRVTDFLDDCMVRFEAEYDNVTICLELQDYNTLKVSFVSFWFMFFYCWMAGLTVLFIGWCYYNQKIHPVPESEAILLPLMSSEDGREWIQIGYKFHWIGFTICFLVWLTLWGFQCLLIFLTICYYMQQGSITRWPLVFEDEMQSLEAFIMVWCVGFVYSFAFQWPESIASIFRRRCPLDEATIVAIVAPTMKIASIGSAKQTWGEKIALTAWMPFDFFFRALFSYQRFPEDYVMTFCNIDKQSASFYYRMGRYVFSNKEGRFVPGSMDVGTTVGDFLEQSTGLTSKDAGRKLSLVGPNIISIEKPSWPKILYREFSQTFYLYQTYMLWTWIVYWYFHMALIGTIVRIIGGLTVASYKYANDSALYKLSTVEGEVEVIRDDVEVVVPVSDLVPGDLVVVKPGVVYCDMVVLESEHLLVDESALTGESVAVSKSKLDVATRNDDFKESENKQYTLYAGTSVLETGDMGKERALVIATGSFTKKGQLLSDILSYQRHKFQFDHEVNFVLLLLMMEAIVLIIMVFNFLGGQFVFAWFYSNFILATIYPPLLLTVFVVSVGVSAGRLQKKRITCINSEAILVAGKVNVCCFDKTGTLTNAGMTSVKIDCLGVDDYVKETALGIAVCHNIKMLENGDIIGNEVDRALYLASNAQIDYQKGQDVVVLHNERKYTIRKQFIFDHDRMTQSVIVEADDGKTKVFVKGSGEAILALCTPDSIPSSFQESLLAYSKSGKYVIALACKDFKHGNDYDAVARDEVEFPTSFSFCAFLTMENLLKDETRLVMDDLRLGNILLTMITGDNVYTGIRVAREAGLCFSEHVVLCRLSNEKKMEWINVDSDICVDKPYEMSESVDLAITGEAWSDLLTNDPEYARQVVKYIRVFGRCNPLDKVSAISTLIQQGCITLMCGDGQNDCGALKCAHVGVALSCSDASIVSPFTSMDLKLSAVTDVLLEGRCALSSAFKVYTYYMIYGQVAAFLQTINAYFVAGFGDWAWVFIDGIWPITLSFSLPLAKAANKLSTCRPTASLFGARTLTSLCGMLAFNVMFIAVALKTLFNQDWFQCRMWDQAASFSGEILGDNFETSVLFIVGGFQLIITAIALNFGYTWRAAWYTNYWFVFFSSLFVILQIVMTLYPSKFSCIWRVNCSNENVVLGFGTTWLYPINNPYNTTVLPVGFQWKLVGIMLSNLVTLCSWEYFIVNGFLYKKFSFGKDETLEYASIQSPITMHPKETSDYKQMRSCTSDASSPSSHTSSSNKSC